MRAALLVCDFVLRAVFLGAPRGALCVFARRRRHRRRRRRRHRRRWRHARQLVAARRTAALRRDDRPRLALASRAFALAIRSPALVDARERRGRRAWRRWRRRGRKRQRRRRGRKRGGRRRPRHASNPRILTVPARPRAHRALDEVRFPSRALHAGEADRPGAHPVQRAAVGGHRTREAEVAAHDLCVVQVPVVVAYLRWGGVGRSAMCMRGVGKGRRRRSRRLRLPSTRCRRPP